MIPAGPVAPIPPSFDSITGELVTDDARAYIAFLAEGGFRTFMTTAGTSQFALMSVEEIRALNDACREAAADAGGVLIAGLPPLHDRALADEIRRANECDSPILLLYPERFYGDRPVAEHFMHAADISVNPVLFHGKPMECATGGVADFSPGLAGTLAAHPNIIGMKEECSTMRRGFELAASLNGNKDFTIIAAGGSQRRFLLMHAAGAWTFLAGAGSVVPALDVAFHDAIARNNMSAARRLLKKETQLFNVFMRMGWHKALRTALRQAGFIRGDRRPFPSATPEEAAVVEAAVRKLTEDDA